MIHTDSRSLEWIDHVAASYPVLNKTLIEKSIRAFSLLESLARSGCPFCFKGGTAIQLITDSRRRLSIDIDIICPPGTDVAKYVNTYAADYDFSDIHLTERKSAHKVPKSHAKYFYQVSYVTNTDTDNILLDVLFEDLHYAQIVQHPIRSPFLKTEGEDVMVNVPSVADILGDKLTAFAPHTTGVPFYKGERDCSVDIIKQMFDVASLLDIVNDLQLTAQTFDKFAKVELGYRDKQDMTPKDVLQDAIDTALCVSMRGLHNPDEFKHLSDGIKRLRNNVHSCKYNLDYAIVDASKAAYTAAMVMRGKTEIRRFSKDMSPMLAGMNIGMRLPTKLNKLKKTHPEAFYYWALVDEVLAEV